MKKVMTTLAIIAMLAAPIGAWAQKGGGGGGGGNKGGGGGGGNRGGGQVNPGGGRPQGQGGQGQGRGNQGPGNQGGRGQEFRGPTAPGPRVNVGGNAGANLGGNGGAQLRGNAGAGAQYYRPGNQSIYRNQIQIGQRPYNIASNNYRPSYQNYRWHNGYWNNSYGWNPQIGYGRNYWAPGYGYGNYGGYGIRIGNVTLGVGGNRGWGGYGNYGGYGYGRYPIGWGYGGWGLGNTLYRSGYTSYFNPYWNTGSGATYVYDYAQPIYVSDSVTDASANSNNTLVDAAVEDFKQGDYQSALTQIDQAIKANPNDGVLHELRSLTLFAMKKYGESAATIHSVLAVGPGWDWPTMASLYPDVELYTAQLRELESFAKANSEDAAAQFLLGYHYMTLGHPENAATEFSKVVKMQPKDRVARDLLALVDKPKEGQPETLPAPGENATEVEGKPEEPPPAPFKAEAIAGNWNASRDDGAKFKLDLNADKTFKWHYEQGERHDEFEGTYTTEGSLLVLQRKDGGAMVGHVAPDGDGKFTFKLLGAPEDDPGLAFNR